MFLLIRKLNNDQCNVLIARIILFSYRYFVSKKEKFAQLETSVKKQSIRFNLLKIF